MFYIVDHQKNTSLIRQFKEDAGIMMDIAWEKSLEFSSLSTITVYIYFTVYVFKKVFVTVDFFKILYTNKNSGMLNIFLDPFQYQRFSGISPTPAQLKWKISWKNFFVCALKLKCICCMHVDYTNK